MRLQREQFPRMRPGVDAERVMAGASEVELRSFAIQRRETPEKGLDQAHEGFATGYRAGGVTACAHAGGSIEIGGAAG
jgi:hypothetical protein